MRVLRVLCAALVMIVAFAVGIGSAAAAPPGVAVSRTHGLHGGDVVRVTGHGITAGAAVQVRQCDVNGADDPNGDDVDYCPAARTVTASAAGTVSLRLRLVDPAFRQEAFGDPVPVYCRADICRIFLVWTDATGTEQSVQSPLLHFSGSPATVAATPNSDLADTQVVRVSGTALGAQGRKVQIVEHLCFQLVQGSGCEGELAVVTTTVGRDGTFAADYEVDRFLPDGTDCADTFEGNCVISATVLKADGQPDNSFGYAPIGDPSVYLSFAGDS